MDNGRIAERDRAFEVRLDRMLHEVKVAIAAAVRAFQMEVLRAMSAFDIEANRSLDRIELQQLNFKATLDARIDNLEERLCVIERRLGEGQ
jgi:hypothetical protein